MKRTSTHYPRPVRKRYLVIPLPSFLPRLFRKHLWTAVMVVGSNLATYSLWEHTEAVAALPPVEEQASGLYLLDKAGVFAPDLQAFEAKVREISSMLRIPPEWLMAVMYAESKFDTRVRNVLGSGAVGLIQFMPQTAAELNVSIQRLAHMDHLQQLEYVYLYLQQVRQRYGEYESLTDLYLGILYPKARKQDDCFTLYAKPAKAYRQNKILDENADGRVTVSDIDRRMQRMFPTAYQVGMSGPDEAEAD